MIDTSYFMYSVHSSTLESAFVLSDHLEGLFEAEGPNQRDLWWNHLILKGKHTHVKEGGYQWGLFLYSK